MIVIYYSPIILHYPLFSTSQLVLMVKNPSTNSGDIRDMGLIPRFGRYPGIRRGNPFHYSCKVNPMDRGMEQRLEF